MDKTYLGMAWWVIDPLINTGIYYFVFSVIMKSRVENFVPFLLIGIVLFRWFDAALKAGSKAILSNMAFVRQVAFHKMVFPIANMLTQSMHVAFSLSVLLVVLQVYGFNIQVHYVALPALLLAELLLITAVALPVCAVLPFVPDLRNLVDYVLRVGFFMSGVMYSGFDVPMSMQWLFWLNPVAQSIHANRQILMYGEWRHWPLPCL